MIFRIKHFRPPIQIIHDCLKLLPVILNNSRMIKMHDILPLSLFSFDHLFILYENKYFPALVYFLPWTLLIEAMTNELINLSERISLLDVVFFIMFLYRNTLRDIIVNCSGFYQIPFTKDDLKMKLNMLQWIEKHWSYIKEIVATISVNKSEI